VSGGRGYQHVETPGILNRTLTIGAGRGMRRFLGAWGVAGKETSVQLVSVA
jgi:hypothetical protein